MSTSLARRAVNFGATQMPLWWLRWSPGPIGALVGFFSGAARRQVRNNQRLIHGRRSSLVELRDVVATMAGYGHALAEGLAIAGDRSVAWRFTHEDAEHFVRATENGRGAVFVTAHVGSWDVAGSMLARRGLKLGMVMAAERNADARAIHDEARTRRGIEIFHVGTDPLAALPLLRHLRSGGIVAMQIDRVPAGMRSRACDFFGARWEIPLGPFQLARLAGVPIIPLFTARTGDLAHLIHVDRPIELPRRASDGELGAAMQLATAGMEAFIRRFPTQWFHFAPHPIASVETELVQVRAHVPGAAAR
ncbi:MAG: lysophospholipid acyltransferase family protein [Polyangiales bacterium]